MRCKNTKSVGPNAIANNMGDHVMGWRGTRISQKNNPKANKNVHDKKLRGDTLAPTL